MPVPEPSNPLPNLRLSPAITPFVIDLLVARGLTPDDACEWMRLYTEGHLHEAGFLEILHWHRSGFTPAEAVPWLAITPSARTAKKRRKAEFTPDRAHLYLRSGATVTEARAWDSRDHETVTRALKTMAALLDGSLA